MMGATISPGYLAEQVTLHQSGYYGVYSDKWAPFVLDLAVRMGATSILDYGCGQGKLVEALAAEWHGDVHGYDPAVPAFAHVPDPADLVVCTDVLEHVEPECLKAVCADLVRVTRGALFVVIATRPATKWLSDGRNAHLIIRDESWWRHTLVSRGWVRVPASLPSIYDPDLEYAALCRPAGGRIS